MNEETDTVKRTKVFHRIKELLNNKAFLPDKYKDGHRGQCPYWAQREISNGTAFDTVYEIRLKPDGSGIWWIASKDISDNGRIVTLDAATQRHPEIGAAHNFEVRDDGQVIGLPSEFVRKIFSWEF